MSSEGTAGRKVGGGKQAHLLRLEAADATRLAGRGDLDDAERVVAIRPATSADFDRVVEITFGSPADELVALAGSRELATRFGEGLLGRGFATSKHPAMVAVVDAEAMGVIQYVVVDEPERTGLGEVRVVLDVFGVVGAIRRLRRFYGLTRVQFSPPRGSFYIAELHVDPRMRGAGIGGALLDWAVSEARRLGCTSMSLHTTTSNPARRLYERHGFVVTRTKTDRNYERYTGIAGRCLMERDC